LPYGDPVDTETLGGLVCTVQVGIVVEYVYKSDIAYSPTVVIVILPLSGVLYLVVSPVAPVDAFEDTYDVTAILAPG
jgi:hypothetical protein